MKHEGDFSELSFDELRENVEDLTSSEGSAVPIGLNYTEEETILALAVCAAGMCNSHKEGNMADVEEGLRMVRGLLVVSKLKWGDGWSQMALFLPALESACRHCDEDNQ